MMTGGVDYVSMSTDLRRRTYRSQRETRPDFRPSGGNPAPQLCPSWPGMEKPRRNCERGIGSISSCSAPMAAAGLGKLLLGSVAEDILRHAAMPGTDGGSESLRTSANCRHSRTGDAISAPVELELRQILFATNFAQNSALRRAGSRIAGRRIPRAADASACDRGLYPIGQPPGPMEDGIRRLHDLIPRNAALQYLPETLLEFGSRDGLHPESRVGARSRHDRARRPFRENVGTTHLPWSTAHHVIAQAHCPVLTIRC